MSTSPVSADYETVKKIVESIRTKVTKGTPTVGIICGSGLGSLVNAVQDSISIPYTNIPGFPKSTVVGHKGNLVFGTIGSKNVVIMQGRFHAYEGYTNDEIAIPIRVMKLLGVEILLVSNAAGGLNRLLKLGDFVLINDHISFPSLSLQSVLVGSNEDRFGPRFPATSRAYDQELRALVKTVAEEKGIRHLIHEGIYCFCGGPTYESPAEARMLLMLGGDVTGMSTVPEVIVARHCGMRVLAISLVTNLVVMEPNNPAIPNHEEVLHTANKRAEILQDLFTEMIKRI